MENVLMTTTLEKTSFSGTLELIEVTTESGTEYDITYLMSIPDPLLSKIDKRYNVARIENKKSAQKFYRKQMKKLIKEGVLNYFFDLDIGAI